MCGIAAVDGHRFAPKIVCKMLFAMQSRGQGSCGITINGQRAAKFLGLVEEGFSDDVLHRLRGNRSVGHVRYATQGTVSLENAGPFRRRTSFGEVVLTHNGHLVNYDEVRLFLERKGVGFEGTCDGELEVKLIVWRMEQNGHDPIDAIRYAMKKLVGSYAIVLMTPDGMYAFRDHWGFRPLSIGRKNGAHYFASETCAFNSVGAQFVRDVEPGEIVRLQAGKLKSYPGRTSKGCEACIFELIYFAFPSSTVFGIPVWQFRQRMGERMASLFQPKLDELLGRYGREEIVIGPIPDTAREATLAFVKALGMQDRYTEILLLNHYVGRTFINPGQRVREQKVEKKFAVKEDAIKGKVVVIVDDSIVHGSTTKKIVLMLKKHGAKEVHVVIYSPPIIGPCFMGIDTPTSDKLIAYSMQTTERVAARLCADSLKYAQVIDLTQVVQSFGQPPDGFCLSCFNRRYALRIPAERLA